MTLCKGGCTKIKAQFKTAGRGIACNAPAGCLGVLFGCKHQTKPQERLSHADAVIILERLPEQIQDALVARAKDFSVKL